MSASPLERILSPARLGQIVMGKERLEDGRTVPKYKRYDFVNLLNRELVALAAGDFKNLAVFAPPRHGKSQLLNVLFAAWFLGIHPDRQVIVASHSATLAGKFGMQVRDILTEFGSDLFGVRVREDRRAIDNWGLTAGGGMLSIGVGGSLVGHGADLFIFDDIIADSAAALSETVRRNTLDWYESTAETRVNAGGLQVFTMQRWHEDDPARRVVFDHADRWRILNLPALAEEGDILQRRVGEALWPERWPVETLLDMQARKPFWFAAQYQQRPVPRGGGRFKREWFDGKYVREAPEQVDARVRWWDKATTQGKGDWSVGARLSRVGHKFYIENIRRGRWAGDVRDSVIRITCDNDNLSHPNGIVTWGEQEPGSSGKDAALQFERMLAPHAARTERATGSKEVRADAFASACERGDVYLVRDDEWNEPLIDELCVFPMAKNDDQVDACSGAFNKLALDVGPGGFATVSASEYAELATEAYW